jgi:hypothetical protein
VRRLLPGLALPADRPAGRKTALTQAEFRRCGTIRPPSSPFVRHHRTGPPP